MRDLEHNLGATLAGADVTLIGLASTDQLYFASGQLNRAGAMFTASHNPAQYNGIKLCRSEARPVGMETGLAEIRAAVASGELVRAAEPGLVDELDVLADYGAYLRTLVPVGGRPLTVVVDAGNGMAGLTAPANGWTYAEMRDYARQLTTADRAGVCIGKEGYIELAMAVANGLNFGEDFTYDNEAVRAYYQFLSELIADGSTPAEQVGLIGTHWSKGWIIEHNIISDSKCSGLTLGKDRQTSVYASYSARAPV